MKKALPLIICMLMFSSLFGFGKHELNKIKKNKVTSLDFCDLGGLNDSNIYTLYSSDDTEMVQQFLDELLTQKKLERRYLGASYGRPSLKFKALENGVDKYYHQIPIKEITPVVEAYKPLFTKHTMIMCSVLKGECAQTLVSYLETHGYKYFTKSVEGIPSEDPYCEISISFKDFNRKRALSYAQEYYDSYCAGKEYTSCLIRINPNIHSYSPEGRIYYSELLITTDSYEECKRLDNHAQYTHIRDYRRFDLLIEDTFFENPEWETLFGDIITCYSE